MQRFGAEGCETADLLGSFVEASHQRAFTGHGRRYFVGRCFAYWQDGTRALGTLMWGQPLEADIAEMMPFFELGVHPRFKGHSSFVDGRGLEAVDVLAFKKLLGYLVARRHAWGPNVGRQAILHPGGFIGVIVSGALHVARPPYPFECFGAADGREAFEWCEVADLHDEVEGLRRKLSSVPEIVRSVQEVLEKHPQLPTSQVARALGLSARTLQRRLEEAGSSLRTERQRRLSLQIEELLSGTELDLDAIAAKVGLNSAAHLVRHFRGTHHTTPGAWRDQRRD